MNEDLSREVSLTGAGEELMGFSPRKRDKLAKALKESSNVAILTADICKS